MPIGVIATGDVVLGRSTTPRARRNIRALWGVHSSGRFDRPVGSWRRSIARLTNKGAWITGTEAAGRTQAEFHAALARTGWDYAHLAGAALGECYATWDASRFELTRPPFAHKLTDKTWVRSEEYGGKTAAKVHALVVPLQTRMKGWRTHRRDKYVLIVVHWPLDNTAARAEAWLDVERGIAHMVHEFIIRWMASDFIVVGDVNKNLRLPAESAQVAQHIETPNRMRACWRGRMPRGGTHGDQVIDMAFGEPGVITAAKLLPDDPSSDHRPFRYRLRTKLPKPAA